MPGWAGLGYNTCQQEWRLGGSCKAGLKHLPACIRPRTGNSVVWELWRLPWWAAALTSEYKSQGYGQTRLGKTAASISMCVD